MKLKIIILLIFLSTNVLATQGVNPGSYEINFEPNLTKQFIFDFVEVGNTNIIIEGNLKNYLTLNKEKIKNSEKIIATLTLPEEEPSPGINNIKIIAGKTTAFIKIIVPYPENFVKLELSVPNLNINEEIQVNLNLENLGNKPLTVSANIEIKNSNKIKISKTKTINLNKTIDLNFNSNINLTAGDYIAIATINYKNNTKNIEKSFRVGEKKLKILNYTKEVKQNQISKFEIQIESLWNNNLEEVYAEIRGNNIAFDTSIIKLNPWEKNTLTGYIDTRNIEINEIKPEITFYYDKTKQNQILEVKIKNNQNWLWILIILIVLTIIFYKMKIK